MQAHHPKLPSLRLAGKGGLREGAQRTAAPRGNGDFGVVTLRCSQVPSWAVVADQQDQPECEAASAASGRPWDKGDGRAPGPQQRRALQVRAQEHRPSNAVFTKVKNINSTHSAPPVVSTRPRCVPESACVHTCARTRSGGAGVGSRSAQDGSSGAAVNTDKYSICPVLPAAARQRGRRHAFLLPVKDPGSFQQRGELGSRRPQPPAARGRAAAPSEFGSEWLLAGHLPGCQLSPPCAACSACCTRQGCSVRIKK